MRKESLADIATRVLEATNGRVLVQSENPVNKPRKLICTCVVHGGSFESLVSNAVRGSTGCKPCTSEKSSQTRATTLQAFSEKAKQVKGHESYTYKEYIAGRASKVIVVCPEHGEFTQNAQNHLAGACCPSCVAVDAGARQRHTVESLQKACGYKVLSTEFTGGKSWGEAVCDTHGIFKLLAGQLAGGRKCPKCVAEAGWTLEKVRQRGIDLATGYEYLNLDGVGSYRQLLIKCHKHGEFIQGLAGHLKNAGCPTCADETHSAKRRMTLEHFTKQKELVYGGEYAIQHFGFSEGKGCTETTVTCKEHGNFTMRASDFLKGYGCPACSTTGISKVGDSLLDYVRSLGIEVQPEAKVPGTNWKWDALLPSKGIALELHGVYWHSDEFKKSSYHKDKHLAGLAAGVRTLHIFDDEWKHRGEVVGKLLQTVLGVRVAERVHARKTTVREVSVGDAKPFLDANHIQGYCASGKHYGLYAEGSKLVAVLSLSLKEPGRSGKSDTRMEITRFATECSVVGGFSKLLSHAVKAHPLVTTVATFSDIRLFTGETYKLAGFTPVATLPPDYFYCRRGRRVHKCTMQKSRIASSKDLLFDPSLTEKQLAELNGIHRVYDCGKVRWEKKVR